MDPHKFFDPDPGSDLNLDKEAFFRIIELY